MKKSQNHSIYTLHSQKSNNLIFNNAQKNNTKHMSKQSIYQNKLLNSQSNIQQNFNLNKNYLHQQYTQLLPELSLQYPYLSKLIYLQLILRQNMLILSNRRQQIKQIWKEIFKKLLYPKSMNIFIINQQTKIEELLEIKENNNYNIILVFDISKLNNIALNKLINYDKQISILAIESFNVKIHQDIKSLFSVCFLDQEQENFQSVINKINQKTISSVFPKDNFHQMIKQNFQMSLQTHNNTQTNHQSVFLKPYLILLKALLEKQQITVAHSKWKKMVKILQFIAVSKHQNQYKRLSLSDYCLTPFFLGSSKDQIQKIIKNNEIAIIQLVNYYGKGKFLSNIQNHFWISDSLKKYYNSLISKMPNKVTYFYACSKYPETVSIMIQNLKAFYRIKGFQKKLMSDKYIEIPQNIENKEYKLRITYRSNSKILVYFGIACFDQYKNIISPIQVCRKQSSAIKIGSIQGNKIYPTSQTKINLKNWNFKKKLNESQIYSFEKSIGIYPDGDITKLPSINFILNSQQSYSTQTGIYSNITDQYIQLSNQGFQKLKKVVSYINQDTIFMNHIEQGSYVINFSNKSKQQEWKQLTLNYNAIHLWNNTGNSFLYKTKFIRILLMINYNSGFPDFYIENKQAETDIKDIQWVQINK